MDLNLICIQSSIYCLSVTPPRSHEGTSPQGKVYICHYTHLHIVVDYCLIMFVSSLAFTWAHPHLIYMLRARAIPLFPHGSFAYCGHAIGHIILHDCTYLIRRRRMRLDLIVTIEELLVSLLTWGGCRILWPPNELPDSFTELIRSVLLSHISHG